MRVKLGFLGWLSLLLIAAGCEGSSDLGASCDPADAASCADGLICSADAAGDNVCQIAAGGECDVGDDPTGCVLGSACVEVTETVDGEERTLGRCLVTEGGACDPAMPFCAPDLVCDPLVDGTSACHAPLILRGRVFDSSDLSGIAGAHVLGLDDESVAVTDVAISIADGSYDLVVPAVREADGAPVSANYTLRASADGYQTFPGGIRTALPINASMAARDGAAYVISGTITDIVLIELADPAAPRAAISGNVVADGAVGGVLVVAQSGGVGWSAVSDARGAYTIFNVPPGDYEVRGYAADLQLTPVGATVADVDLEGVDLLASAAPLSTLSGSIQLVNASAGTATSIVLVVRSTFDENFARGEVPPGLRAPRTGPVSIDGSWTIAGVPDGEYVVLAAFENDLLVRDPDQNIAGTTFVIVTLPDAAGPTVELAESFKVTDALAVVGPGSVEPEAVSAPPLLEWADDSSEDYYTVVVYNAYGDLVWEDPMVPNVSGSDTVTRMYEGPLEVGMYYQFRATSWRAPGGRMPSPISTTEDLLGVFYGAP